MGLAFFINYIINTMWEYKWNDKTVWHPTYYNTYNGFEVIDIVRQLDFDRWCAVKYILRAGLKDNNEAQTDIAKAIRYLQDYINNFLNDNPNE